jgi:hypothetical protein
MEELTTEQQWLQGSSILDQGIPLLQKELMDPRDFYQQINIELDDYYKKTTDIQSLFKPQTMDDEELQKSILQRLCVGWYNEIAIRDFCQLAMEVAPPSLKTQKALLRQVNDEHQHATWIWRLLKERGVDPRVYGTIEEWRYVWAYRTGLLRKPENFFIAFASTQLVSERLVAMKNIPEMVEMCKDFDPEVADLYGNKIYHDEVFHTDGLPEFIITKHATTLDAQNRVRLGIKRGLISVDLVARGIKRSRDNYIK